MRSDVKRKTILASLIFASAAVAGSQINLIAQCPISPSIGTPSKFWDGIFTQNGPGKGLESKGSPGWTGADSAYSILLPDGDSAFLFSDSYIAESPAAKDDGTVTVDKNGVRTTAINCKPPVCDPEASTFAARNSIVILSKDKKHLKTLAGPKDKSGLSGSYFPLTENGRHYWVGDAAVIQTDAKGTKKLIVFLMKFDDKLAYHGSAIAKLNASTLEVENITELKNEGDPATHWGTALRLEGKFGKNYVLYVYGEKITAGKKQAAIAKIDLSAGWDKLTNIDDWNVWNGNTWLEGLGSEAAIVPVNDSISDEFSVAKFKVNGRDTYIMVGMDTAVPYEQWKDITLYSSCAPQGPFTGKHGVYVTPETTAAALPGFQARQKLTGKLVVYNPHIHSQFSGNGELLISYNLNRRHNSDSIYIDGYRPRFITVPVKGLK
jgi:hypothetical protein